MQFWVLPKVLLLVLVLLLQKLFKVSKCVCVFVVSIYSCVDSPFSFNMHVRDVGSDCGVVTDSATMPCDNLSCWLPQCFTTHVIDCTGRDRAPRYLPWPCHRLKGCEQQCHLVYRCLAIVRASHHCLPPKVPHPPKTLDRINHQWGHFLENKKGQPSFSGLMTLLLWHQGDGD